MSKKKRGMINEIEVQKLIIKEAFSQKQALPNFGGLSDDGCVKLRNYIWKISGVVNNNPETN